MMIPIWIVKYYNANLIGFPIVLKQYPSLLISYIVLFLCSIYFPGQGYSFFVSSSDYVKGLILNILRGIDINILDNTEQEIVKQYFEQLDKIEERCPKKLIAVLTECINGTSHWVSREESIQIIKLLLHLVNLKKEVKKINQDFILNYPGIKHKEDAQFLLNYFKCGLYESTLPKLKTRVLRKIPFLVGPPRTGKTHFVKELCRQAKLDCIRISHSDFREDDLLGYHRDIKSSIIASRLHEIKSKPFVIHLDEVDKLKNGNLMDLLNFLDSSIPKRILPLFNYELNGSDFIITASGNEKIKESQHFTKATIEAYDSRIRYVVFDSLPASKKEEILLKNTEDILEEYNLNEIPKDLPMKIKQWIELDKNEPGISNVSTKLYEELLLQSMLFNVE